VSPRGTRDRMIDSAIVLMRERGAAAVSIDAVLTHSGAPRGSVYHHFPGGRDELILAAGRRAANVVSGLISQAAEAGDARAAVERIAAFWKKVLVAGGFRAGCPIVALAVDARADLPEAEAVVREEFERWQGLLREAIEAGGVQTAEADELAALVLAAIEGAVVLCRGKRSVEPLDVVTRRLVALLPAR